MNIEEIKDRVNKTKNAFHKLGIEGQVNLNVMLNDIEFLLKEIEELKKPKYIINCKTNEITKLTNDFVSKDKIKAKIEELEKQDREYRMSHNYLVIPVLQSLLEKE